MTADSNAARLGTRLRRIRHQQELSLADVEEQSAGQWKAVVVGAYERGDRAVSLTRLAALAGFYGVPLADLLPGAEVEATREGGRRVVLDLTSLSAADADEVAAVARFAEQVQRRRGDHNGRVLSLRADDMEVLAVAVGTDSDALLERLREHGALVAMAPPSAMA